MKLSDIKVQELEKNVSDNRKEYDELLKYLKIYNKKSYGIMDTKEAEIKKIRSDLRGLRGDDRVPFKVKIDQKKTELKEFKKNFSISSKERVSEMSKINKELTKYRNKLVIKVSQLNMSSYKVGDVIGIDSPQYPKSWDDGESYYCSGIGRLRSDIKIIRVNKVSLTVEYTTEEYRGDNGVWSIYSKSHSKLITLDKIRRIERNTFSDITQDDGFLEDKKILIRDEIVEDLF